METQYINGVALLIEPEYWVYYSPETDEIFTLQDAPPRPCYWYELRMEDSVILRYITCLGKL